MSDARFTALTERTFTTSDLAYRIGLVKEFLEYAFYKLQDAHATRGAISAFAQDAQKGPDDVRFLESLPETFYAAFERDSFYDALKTLTEESHALKTLGLTVPVVLTRTDIDTIGAWVRANVRPDILLDLSVDDSIAVGCRVIWHDVIHDFSINYYLTKHAKEVHAHLLERTSVR